MKNSPSPKQKSPQVPLDLWRKLYHAADEYYKLVPWEVLSEDDLFAMRDPLSGQVHYCSVLGEIGEFLGLTLYRGRTGLEFHFKCKNSGGDPDHSELLEIYDAIVTEFCERSSLGKEDLQVIKSLAPEFSGRRIYPHFQSYIPGSVPWNLTAEEVRLTTLAFQCAGLHVERCRNDASFRDVISREDEYLLYTPRSEEDKEFFHCETSWHKLESLSIKIFDHILLDEQKIKRLKEKELDLDSPWEVAVHLFPESVISGQDRPYWLRLVLLLHEASCYILQTDSLSPEACPHLALRDALLVTIEKFGRIPSTVLVNNKNSYSALLPLVKALGIDVEIRESLPGILEAQDFLRDAMGK